jgi:hypothetical protein
VARATQLEGRLALNPVWVTSSPKEHSCVNRILLLEETPCSVLPLEGTYLVDEVTNVTWVGHHRPDWVLGLGAHRPLIHPSHSGGLAQHMLHGFRLLQLAEVVVLGAEAKGVREVSEGTDGVPGEPGAYPCLVLSLPECTCPVVPHHHRVPKHICCLRQSPGLPCSQCPNPSCPLGGVGSAHLMPLLAWHSLK